MDSRLHIEFNISIKLKMSRIETEGREVRDRKRKGRRRREIKRGRIIGRDPRGRGREELKREEEILKAQG